MIFCMNVSVSANHIIATVNQPVIGLDAEDCESRALSYNKVSDGEDTNGKKESTVDDWDKDGGGKDGSDAKEAIVQSQNIGVSDYEHQKQKNIAELWGILDKIKEDHGYAELVKDIKKSVQDKKGKKKETKKKVSATEQRKLARQKAYDSRYSSRHALTNSI